MKREQEKIESYCFSKGIVRCGGTAIERVNILLCKKIIKHADLFPRHPNMFCWNRIISHFRNFSLLAKISWFTSMYYIIRLFGVTTKQRTLYFMIESRLFLFPWCNKYYLHLIVGTEHIAIKQTKPKFISIYYLNEDVSIITPRFIYLIELYELYNKCTINTRNQLEYLA